jgi:hypothetical protein
MQYYSKFKLIACSLIFDDFSSSTENNRKKYSFFMKECMQDSLLKAVRTKQITNYGWNILLNAVRLMIQNIRERK